MDARQGASWYQVNFLGGDGTLVSQGQPALLQVP
jgi:hypothetical protein